MSHRGPRMYADCRSFCVPIQSVQSCPAPIPLTGDRTTVPRGMPLTELQSASLSAEETRQGQVLGGKSFLATKVRFPPRCPGLIDRPRLLALASRLAAKRLAVIKAPAGFGKTSLAASWSDWLRESASSVAWLAIDSGDDEPSRFLFYMTQAMQRVAPAVGSDGLDLIKESFLISPQAIVSSLINDLIDVEEEVYLFLEDYHWVTDPGIHDAVAFFLRHAPSHVHVVLTTRTEPPLPLASLRANNQLLEIDASKLQFDLQETRELFEREKPGSLELADVKLLHSRTEGWPAALRTSSRLLLFPGQDFAQFVRNLSGTQRTINAYLAGDARWFAGRPLSRSCYGRQSSIGCPVRSVKWSLRPLRARRFLHRIEKRQLLLTALDQEGRWFRYHPLLAGYLRQRLESELGDELPELHRRAAGWYASQELWTEAVQHAIAAGDTNQALDWIKNCAMGLVKRGDLFTLLAWQRVFPAEVMRGQPAVKLAIAWGLALAVRADEALQILDEIEQDLGTRNSVDRDVLTCECQAIRAVALSLKDEGRVALPLAEQCLTKSTDPWTANVASNVVRYWRCKTGDFERFYETPWIPYSLDDDGRNVFASVYRRCIQGIAEAQQLRIAAAERHYAEASRLAEQHVGPNSVAAALPASLTSRIRYEQGRAEEAEAMLVDRLAFVSEGAMLECVLSAYFTMVRIAALRMNFDRAHTLLERAENLGRVRDWGRLCAGVALERVWLHRGRRAD